MNIFPDPFSLPDGTPLPIPNVTEGMLRALESRFPDRAPRLGMTMDEVWYMAGAAAVVAAMRRQLDDEDPATGLPRDPNPPAAAPTAFERTRRLTR